MIVKTNALLVCRDRHYSFRVTWLLSQNQENSHPVYYGRKGSVLLINLSFKLWEQVTDTFRNKGLYPWTLLIIAKLFMHFQDSIFQQLCSAVTIWPSQCIIRYNN